MFVQNVGNSSEMAYFMGIQSNGRKMNGSEKDDTKYR
jgi:hypothetical protein